MRHDVCGVQVLHSLGHVCHKGQFKTGIKLEALILQHVLQTGKNKHNYSHEESFACGNNSGMVGKSQSLLRLCETEVSVLTHY